jgi:hypothetical protein
MNKDKVGFFKRFALKFDEFIKDGGVGAALFFIMVELTYLNAKALHRLDNPEGTWNIIPAVIGSLAFSTATIVVMRRPGHKWLKRILPIFDTALVFLALNVRAWDVLLQYPGELIQSGFFALFTGFITYSLGMINFEEHVTDIDRQKKELVEIKEAHIKELKSLHVTIEKLKTDKDLVSDQLEELRTENLSLSRNNQVNGTEFTELQEKYVSAKALIEDRETEMSKLKREKDELHGDLKVLVKKIEEQENLLENKDYDIEKMKVRLKDMDKYEKIYLMSEKSRILKKSEANRTEVEKALLERAEDYLSDN